MTSRVERKKRRIKPYIIMIFVTLAGIIGLSLYMIMNNSNSSQGQKAADAFIQILVNKEYEKLGEVLEKDSYDSLGYTLEEVIDKYDHIFNGINIHGIHASNIELKNSITMCKSYPIN
ncbi:NTF2-like N-terminal transpeptidase domain-containing protein [Niallia circulans]